MIASTAGRGDNRWTFVQWSCTFQAVDEDRYGAVVQMLQNKLFGGDVQIVFKEEMTNRQMFNVVWSCQQTR